MKLRKFSQALPDNAFDILESIAKERQIPSVQELIRSVIIPDWVRKQARKQAKEE